MIEVKVNISGKLTIDEDDLGALKKKAPVDVVQTLFELGRDIGMKVEKVSPPKPKKEG